MCAYSDTWVVTPPGNPDERALSFREMRTFAQELASEHPDHPRPRAWADAARDAG